MLHTKRGIEKAQKFCDVDDQEINEEGEGLKRRRQELDEDEERLKQRRKELSEDEERLNERRRRVQEHRAQLEGIAQYIVNCGVKEQRLSKRYEK